MIPKIIHYCWFGDNPKDEATLKFIEGWKKFLPDYEIREWTDTDLIKIKNKYVAQAYQNKKWAFVSDYVRLYALYNEGGIYFDTDIEVRKSFDKFLNLDFFIGSELYEKSKQIGTAVIGAKKKSPIIADLLKEYNDIAFIKEKGDFDYLPNTQRLIKPLKKLGFNNIYTEDNPIYLDDKNVIYPIQYFSKDTSESYAVHHFAASWIDGWKKRFNIIIPLGKRYRLSLYKYKNYKKNSQFTYPIHLFKKIFEYNYNNRCLLLSVEKIDYYIKQVHISKLHNKLDKLFAKRFSFASTINIIFRLVKEYFKNLVRSPYWGKDNNIIDIIFKLYGGLGDIIIALNYIEQFKSKFSNINVSITVPSYFYDEVNSLLYKHYKISNVYKDNKKTDADLVIELVRCPVILFADKTKISKVNSELYNWLNKIINFNLEHKEMLNPGTVSDFLLEKYTILQGRKRIQEADIDNLLNIKSDFKIHLQGDTSEILSKFSLNKPYITLQRGIGKADNMDGNKSTRVWPVEYYETLVELIKKEYPQYKIIQTGAKDCSIIKGCDLNLCGKTSFEEMLIILNNAKLHIDGECGMVHMRHFMGNKPSVVLFGPTNEKFYGYDENLNLSARTCSSSCEWLNKTWREKCIYGVQRTCMQTLTPEDVFNKLGNSLK